MHIVVLMSCFYIALFPFISLSYSSYIFHPTMSVLLVDEWLFLLTGHVCTNSSTYIAVKFVSNIEIACLNSPKFDFNHSFR